MKEIWFNNQKDLVLITMIDRLEFFEKHILLLKGRVKVGEFLISSQFQR